MASANVRKGPLLVWNGPTSIEDYYKSKIINEAGVRAEKHGLEKMFDGNRNTCWHNGAEFDNKPKSIKIQFTVSPI